MADGLQISGNGQAPSRGALRARRYRRRHKRDTEAAPGVTRNVTRRRHSGVTVNAALGITVAVTGIVMAAVGASMTVSYMITTATGADRIPLAALAGAADLAALLLPAAAAGLWHKRRRLLAIAAVILWAIAAAVTGANLGGFIAINTDSFAAGRENAATERDLTLSRLARLRDQRDAISERRSIAEITLAVRNAARSNIDSERGALAAAHHRDALDAEIASIEPRIMTLPAVADADALGAIVRMVGINVGDDALRHIRTLLLLTLPLTAGIVMATGIALTRSREAS